jgi:hypothetical protein
MKSSRVSYGRFTLVALVSVSGHLSPRGGVIDRPSHPRSWSVCWKLASETSRLHNVHSSTSL